MKRIQSLVALSALVIAGAGCAANPLVGDWQTSSTNSGATFTITLHLRADGSAGGTIAGSGSCTGMQTFEGQRWSSTDTTITYTGQSACTGMVTCSIAGTSVDIDCSQTTNMQMNGACTYVLSNNNNSLTVSQCSGSTSGSATTLTRAGSGS